MLGRSVFDALFAGVRERILDKYEVLDIYVPIKPIGKQRTHGDNHSTPQKTREWESYVASVVATDIMDGRPPIDFPVAARAILGFEKARPDIDNVEKALWDALWKGDANGRGRAIKDDRFIRTYVEKCEVLAPKGEEFFAVRFYALTEKDYNNYMERCNGIERQDGGY